MPHDHETLAATFMGGELGRARRWRFERHLVDCEHCWSHVQQARAGRAALESLREVAATHTRDRVRATTGLRPAEPVHRRRWMVLPVSAAVATVIAVLVGLSLGQPSSQEILTQLASGYHGGNAWTPVQSAAAPPAANLGQLKWVGATTSDLNGERVFGHRYADSSGSAVLVVLGATNIAQPPGASRAPDGDWIVQADGLTVMCVPDPLSLIVGADPAIVAGAARALVHGDG